MKIDDLENFDELSNFDEIYISDSLNITENLSSKKKILLLLYPNKLETKKKFKNISIKNLALSIFNKDYSFRWKSHKDAINFVEKNFDNLNIINLPIIKLSKLVIKDEKNKLFFKNYLCQKIEKYFFYINLKKFFLEFKKKTFLKITNSDLKEIHNYFYQNNLIDSNEIEFINKRYKIPLNHIKIFIVILFYPLIAIFRSKFKNSIKKNNFKFCIRHYKYGFGINDYPKISEDWMIDHDNFTKEEILFVLEEGLNSEKIKILNNRKYNFVNANYRYPVDTMNLKIFILLTFKFLPLHLVYSLVYLFSTSLNKNILFEILTNFLIWDIFTRNYKDVKYLSYHNFQGSHFIKNYYLNKTGSKSYLYKHSFSENVFDKNIEKYCNSIFSYSCHNYEYQMSNIGQEMSKSNKSNLKKSFITGPIFSSKKFENYLYKTNNNKINISAFNTSFSSHGVNGYYEHYLYLKFLKNLIENYNVNILFKGKYPYELYPKNKLTAEIFSQIIATKRLTLVERYTSPISMINASNMVISMSFATPGFEVLYLKKKCFFVDLSSNYKNSLIDSYTDNFVAHGADDSNKLFKFYLTNNDEVIKVIDKNSNSIYQNSLSKDPINFLKSSMLNNSLDND